MPPPLLLINYPYIYLGISFGQLYCVQIYTILNCPEVAQTLAISGFIITGFVSDCTLSVINIVNIV